MRRKMRTDDVGICNFLLQMGRIWAIIYKVTDIYLEIILENKSNEVLGKCAVF